jgi:L-seryl-tRNA selenium transferase
MKKINSPLSKLPSISELIQHPQVQTVVERVNQTMVARRATGFLEELRQQLKRRSGVVPAMSELAERFARHLLGAEPIGVPVIHATGIALGTQGLVPPLADSALQTMLRTAGEYHDARHALANQVDQLLHELAGAEGTWVAANPAAAHHLAQMVFTDESEVVDASPAGLVNPSRFGLAGIATIDEHLKQAKGPLLVGASGMLGGPDCGIILGRRQQIDQLKQHPLAPSLEAGSLALAALAGTLKLYQSPDKIIHQIPILQLLSTPMENLRQRAQRLAALMAQAEAIAEANPIESESLWCQTSTLHHAAPTWIISLCPSSDESPPIAAGRLQDDLRRSQWPVFSRIADERVVLDLRTVFPRWDQALVTAVEGVPAHGTPEPAQPPSGDSA